MVVVRATGLVKAYDAMKAVNGIDFQVRAAEVRGLLGPNGAGKTTLLRMLFGLVRPDSGSIELLGRSGDDRTAVDLDGVGGFVEEPSFYPYLSGRVNLELLAELDGIDRSPARARIDAALETVGLTGRAEDRCSSYSSGMRQRLGVAAALLRVPRLLLLDEPTSGLDPRGVRDVAALVRTLSSDGVAIVLSSHQIGELEQLCDSFTFIRDGRIVWDGTAAEMNAQAPASRYELATSDDTRATELAERQPGVRAESSTGGGLTLEVDEGCIDEYVLALGRGAVAVRRLTLVVSPLESMFFSLTDEPDPATVAESPTAMRYSRA